MTISADLRASFGDARDQGRRPTCAAFAASDLHAFQFGQFAEFSVEFAFYHAVQRKPNRDPSSGVPLNLLSEAIEKDGQPLESGWPYVKTLPADLSLWK